MNINKKLTAFFIFFSILTLSILNIKNPEKTKFYLFTSKVENITIGNLITITFISGLTFSSLLTLITKNNLKGLEGNFINDKVIDKSDDDNFSEEIQFDRPPERDVRESQPTISVNYRFVDQEINSYDSENTKKQKNNFNNEENDWVNNDNEW